MRFDRRCAFCGFRMTEGTSVGYESDTPPTPGDFSLCGCCGRASRFNESMTLERPLELPPFAIREMERKLRALLVTRN